MAEPTLSLTYADLKAAVGLYLGYGRGTSKGDAAWSTRQSAILDELVKAGLRQFYYPPALDKGGVSYEWSFLHPSATLALAEAATSVTLPDDFGGLDGELEASTGDGAVGVPLKVGGMQMLRALRSQYPATTGRPEWAALDPVRGTTLTKGQRWALEVYPAADADYTLSFAYHLHPEALSGDRPYAYGGPAHAETIEASIRAMAELKLDDVRDGPQKAHFLERLAVSVSQDRKVKPQSLGYNGDRSNSLYGRRTHRRDEYRGRVTVYGTQY